MELITQAILEYLNNKNTLGAIQIDGPWGCGKTFYVKNVLLKKIEEIENQNAEAFKERGQDYEKRIPLMVSLFGVKSVDDIAKQLLFASTHSRYGLSEKRIERMKKALSNIAKCVPYLKELDWDKVLEVPSSTCLKLLNESSIIVLDDLERLSNEIDIEDVLGFVNDLVENYNFKVILISNQENFEESAKKFKEKVIEKTIPFRIDSSNIIKDIAHSYHPQLPDFLSSEYVARFLTSDKEDIDQSKVLSNLRTVRFAVSQFAPIFSYYVETDKPITELNSVVISKLNLLWRFILAISVEYRLGNIAPEKGNDLETADFHFMLKHFDLDGKPSEQVEKEKSFEDKFIQKYYEKYDISYHYISEVYDFIVNGHPLTLDKIDESVSKILGVWKDPMSDEVSFTTNFFERISSLSDNEAPNEFKRFFDYISNGYVTSLLSIINASNILNQYKGVIGLDNNSIQNGLIMGIDKFISINPNEKIMAEEHNIHTYYGDVKKETRDCIDYILKKIESMKQNQFGEYIKTLNYNFENNLELFADEFIPKPISPNVMSISSAILHKMDLKMVEKRVACMNSAKDVETLSKMIYYRFGDNPNSHWSEEVCFIEAIQNGLNSLSEDDLTLSAHFKRNHLIPRINKLIQRTK